MRANSFDVEFTLRREEGEQIMRQDQALTKVCLIRSGIDPSPTARMIESDGAFIALDLAKKFARIVEQDRDLDHQAIALADLIYELNALAAAHGIDLEPFLDYVHAGRIGERQDNAQIDADAWLMMRVSEKDQIARLLDRDDLSPADRGQVETCANLHRAGIPLRWPQRVALARIEEEANERANQSAMAAA